VLVRSRALKLGHTQRQGGEEAHACMRGDEGPAPRSAGGFHPFPSMGSGRPIRLKSRQQPHASPAHHTTHTPPAALTGSAGHSEWVGDVVAKGSVVSMFLVESEGGRQEGGWKSW
jgi:hypothetical protein